MRRVDEIFVPKHIENTETREMVKNSLSKNKRKTNNIEEWREKNAHSQEKKTLSLRFRSPPPLPHVFSGDIYRLKCEGGFLLWRMFGTLLLLHFSSV